MGLVLSGVRVSVNHTSDILNTRIVAVVDGHDQWKRPAAGSASGIRELVFRRAAGRGKIPPACTGGASVARRAGGRRRPHWYAVARGVASQKGGGPVPSSSYQVVRAGWSNGRVTGGPLMPAALNRTPG